MKEEPCIPWCMPQRVTPKRMNKVLVVVVVAVFVVVEKILS